MSSFTLMNWQDHFWTSLSAASALLVLISSVADRRRHKRTKLDQVGIMPWYNALDRDYSIFCADYCIGSGVGD